MGVESHAPALFYAGSQELLLAAVRERGDAAVLEYVTKFDGAVFESAAELKVTDEELARAGDAVGEDVVRAIDESLANVRDFAEKSMRRDWSGTNAQGAQVGERFHPFERVGIYVPGGKAVSD